MGRRGTGKRGREAPALRYFDYPSHTRADKTLTPRCRWPIGVYRSTPHLTTKVESVGSGRRGRGGGPGGGKGLKKEGEEGRRGAYRGLTHRGLTH